MTDRKLRLPAGRIDWVRAAGILDLETGALVELRATGAASGDLSTERLEALRRLLLSGAADAVAALIRAGEAGRGNAAAFRETLVEDASGLLFGKLLRNGDLLVVSTERTESPGRVWTQIKVLLPQLHS